MIVLKLFHYLCRQSVVWFTVIFGFPVNLSAAAKNWSGHWKLSLLSCYVFIFKPANHQKNVYSENFRLYHTIGLWQSSSYYCLTQRDRSRVGNVLKISCPRPKWAVRALLAVTTAHFYVFSFFLCEFTVEWKGKYFTDCDFKAHCNRLLKQNKYLV